MNKIQLHEQEILEKFDKEFVYHPNGMWDEETRSIKKPKFSVLTPGNIKAFISLALHSQVEVIKGMVEKMMDENDDGMWLGMETAENILALLTIHEDKTP